MVLDSSPPPDSGSYYKADPDLAVSQSTGELMFKILNRKEDFCMKIKLGSAHKAHHDEEQRAREAATDGFAAPAPARRGVR